MVAANTLDGDYTIDRFNGAAVSEKYTFSISTVENNTLRIHCKVANVMNGTVKLSDNVLTGMLMSTLMLGSEEQQAIEDAISSGLSKGMRIAQKGRTLLLHSGSSTLRLKKA